MDAIRAETKIHTAPREPIGVTEETCERCEHGEEGYPNGHEDYEIIAIKDGRKWKYFCPKTLEQILPADDWEELSDAEIARINSEKAELVTPAVYRVVKKAAPTEPERGTRSP
jgi:hypothetical protein